MRIIIVMIVLLFIQIKFVDAQGKGVKLSDSITCNPQFPGGLDSLNQYIERNKIYPEEDLSRGIEGMAEVNFIVTENGSITHVRAQSNSKGDKYFDSAAVKMVRQMPNWIPAKNHGKSVNGFSWLPIYFKMKSK